VCSLANSCTARNELQHKARGGGDSSSSSEDDGPAAAAAGRGRKGKGAADAQEAGDAQGQEQEADPFDDPFFNDDGPAEMVCVLRLYLRVHISV